MLEQEGRVVRPDAAALRITQDRILEKTFVRECGIGTAPFAPVMDARDLDVAIGELGFPAVMKTARGGYDGKGQWVVRDSATAHAALAEARGAALIYERFVPFDWKCRSFARAVPMGNRSPFRRARIATITACSRLRSFRRASVPPLPRASARRPRRSGERLGIVGAYCVEFFVAGDEVLVNEIAPRVHNSGHYSLDATQISQYEAHVRAICDLPLVEPYLFSPAVMINILGDGTGDELDGIDELLADPDAKLHVYGKAHAALRRKMGHVTVLGATADEALAKAERARSVLSWRPRQSALGPKSRS